MSPFEIVYGFNPLTPLDLKPIPQVEQVNQDALKRGEAIKKLHQQARENVIKKTENYKKAADKKRKEMVFEPGEWVWIHMRTERFPQKRSSKLAPRGDGPFRVLEKINDNAYRLELPGEFNISHTFNVADLSPYLAGEPVLRSKPSEGGGNDEVIDQNHDPITIPKVTEGPMTRSKERRLKEGFILAVQAILDKLDEPPITTSQPAKVEHTSRPSDDLSNAFAQLNITQGKQAYLDGTDTHVSLAGTEAEEETFPSEDEGLEDSSTKHPEEEEKDKKSLEAGPSRIKAKLIPKKAGHEPREVFSLFTICAGKMGQSSGS